MGSWTVTINLQQSYRLGCLDPQRGRVIVKILDALAAWNPLVTTSFGNKGIAADLGCDLLVADDPAAFAESVLILPKKRAVGGAALGLRQGFHP